MSSSQSDNSNNDRRFVVIMLVLAIGVGALLFRNVQRRSAGSSDYDAVGTVEYKRHVVMRKYGDRFVWEKVNPQTPIFLYDSVLTRDRSDAIITLDNGTRLELDPNTMVEIDMVKEQVGLNLKRGVVNAESTAEEDSFIRTLDGTLIDISGAKTKLSLFGDELDLTVTEGDVTIDGKKLEKGETLTIDKDGKVTRRKVTIGSVAPTDGLVVLTDRSSEVVALKWGRKEGIQNYEIKVARDPRMQKDVRRKTSRGNQVQLGLPAGTWYWQVRSNDGKEASAVNTLKIVNVPPIAIYGPLEDQVLQGNDVTFRWQKPASGVAVAFELARTPSFKVPVKVATTLNSTISARGLKEGTYYWRLSPEYTGGKTNNLAGSSFHTFHVGKVSDDKNVVKVQVEREKELARIRDGRARLVWSKIDEADTYKVEVGRDRNLSDKVLSKKTTDTSVKLPRNLKENDTYYWNVEAKDKQGKTKAKSKTQKFTVVRKKGQRDYRRDDAKDDEALIAANNRRKARQRDKRDAKNQVDRNRRSERDRRVERNRQTKSDRRTRRERRREERKRREARQAKRRQLARVKGLRPRGKVVVNAEAIEPVSFRWGRSRGANQYLFEISRPGKKLVSETIKSTRALVTPNEQFYDRRLTWRVKPQYVQGGKVVREGKYTVQKLRIGYKGILPPRVLKVRVQKTAHR